MCLEFCLRDLRNVPGNLVVYSDNHHVTEEFVGRGPCFPVHLDRFLSDQRREVGPPVAVVSLVGFALVADDIELRKGFQHFERRPGV